MRPPKLFQKIRRTHVLIAAIVVVASSLVALLLAVVMMPSIAENAVRERFDRVEERSGLTITFDELRTSGFRTVEILGLVVTDKDREMVRLATSGVSIQPWALIRGRRVIDGLRASDVEIWVTMQADQTIDWVEVARRSRRAVTSSTGDDEADTAQRDILAIFGGTLPEVDVQNVRIRFRHEQGATPWPLDELEVPEGNIEVSSSGVKIRSSVFVRSSETEKRWSLPTKIELSLDLDAELAPTGASFDFDRPVEIDGIEPFAPLRFGISALRIVDETRIEAEGLTLGLRTRPEQPVLQVPKLVADVGSWPDSLRDLTLEGVEVHQPVLSAHWAADGSGTLTDILYLFVSPQADAVHSRAETIARASQAAGQNAAARVDDVDEPDFVGSQGSAKPRTSRLERLVLLMDRVPASVSVTNVNVKVADERAHPVVQWQTLSLQDGSFSLRNDRVAHSIHVDGAFLARAEGRRQGAVEGSLRWNYKSQSLEASTDVDALEVRWISRLLGPRLGSYFESGILRARLQTRRGQGARIDFEGLASVEDGSFYWAGLAEESLRPITTSYSFAGHWDPVASPPAAKHLRVEDFRAPDRGGPAPGEKARGSVVFTKGDVIVNDVRMSVRPELYGLRSPMRFPARLALHIDLPRTPVQSLLDAVPDAVKGDLRGMRVEGNFAWKFELEVPLNRASDMIWKADPVVEGFELISVPSHVDVRKLERGFEHTIIDEVVEFERTVRIPPMRPIPTKWLLENSGLTLEEIDERRRRKGFPEIDRSIYGHETPEYWLHPLAGRGVAGKPWSRHDTITRTPERPYGPYVFVPLHHISPYLARAVMTTEDNSFFRHRGFNFLAIRESVERNLRAGSFRRGASTISMQLVKNVFLSRTKVISRKIQEVFLTWMMENVAQIPKERILEVYLNVIEYGPEIFGIHEASLHYFGKRPDELTLSEVAWLVTIIPGPKRFHFYWDRGQITDAYFNRMKRYINAMYQRERITQEELEHALEDKPQFYKPGPNDPVLRRSEEEPPPLNLLEWLQEQRREKPPEESPTLFP